MKIQTSILNKILMVFIINLIMSVNVNGQSYVMPEYSVAEIPVNSISVPVTLQIGENFMISYKTSLLPTDLDGQWSNSLRFEIRDGQGFIALDFPVSSVQSGIAYVNDTDGWVAGPCQVRLYAYINFQEHEISRGVISLMEPGEDCYTFGNSFGRYLFDYNLSSQTQWIERVSFGDIQNRSGIDIYHDQWSYGNYSNLVTPISDGMEITLESASHVPASPVPSDPRQKYWYVWIDFNQDGDFDDDDELAFASQENITTEPMFIRGDVNSDGAVDIADIIFLYGVLFKGEGSFRYPDAADVNDDGEINITDGVFLANYLFRGNVQTIPQPFAYVDEFGVIDNSLHVAGCDPTPDNLGGLVVPINVPSTVMSGQTMMRIQLTYGDHATRPCGYIGYGEVEEYTVDIVNSAARFSANGKSEESDTGSANIDLEIKTFPNPSDGIINISVSGGAWNGFSYSIMNIAGQVIEEGHDIYEDKIKLDLSEFKGLSIIKVESMDQVAIQKLLVR